MTRAETQQEKYVAFKTAFEIIKHYQSTNNFIAAYTVAFSIVEDRVRAMYVVRHRADNNGAEPRDVRGSIRSYAGQLRKKGDIPIEAEKLLHKVAEQRNKLLHAAMWNLKAFTEKSVDEVVNLARVMDSHRRAQKKRLLG